MKNFLITLSIIALSVNAEEVTLYEQVTSNIPEIGDKTEVYLGDRMLIQREGEYRECIVPAKSIEMGYSMARFTVKAKKPLCRDDANSMIYYPTYDLYPNQGGVNIGGFKLAEIKSNYEIQLCIPKMMGSGLSCQRKKQFRATFNKDEIEFNDSYFLYTENTFQQSIEYAGRDGDNLKFNYSEFTDGFARQAFTREFQVDYSKGDTAAYKGAIIKIHDATNVNIVYEVIRNFQQ